MHLFKFDHAGKSFSINMAGYTHLTAFCAAYGKKAWKFLELPSSKAFLEAVAKRTGLPIQSAENPSIACTDNRCTLSQEKMEALVVTVQSGDSSLQGTWVHPRVALKCAAWISAETEAWMMEVIEDVIKYGRPAADLDVESKLKLEYRQWRETRLKAIAADAAALAESGLQTLAQYRAEAGLSRCDQLLVSRLARRAAISAGEAPARVFTKGGMRRAYSAPVLKAALAQMPPYLPGFEPTQVG